MRHLYTCCLLLLALVARPAHAAPGDTTRVQVWNALRLDHHGDYDATANFPQGGGPYRKILLHYKLGRYACPAGTQYCGSWDYTTRVLLQPPTADTLELMRVITPYASNWSTTRYHDYVTDVTDYAAQLTSGPQPLRFIYDGYSWGFTVSVWFEFIEGPPAREVLAVRKLYDGVFAFGKTADPIESHLTPKSVYIPGGPTVSQVQLKTLVTGHGSDGRQCAEFCSKYYQVLAGGQDLGNTQIWRDDCGRNPVSPQTGTWVYERANWCPGQMVKPIYHDLTAQAQPGVALPVDINMQPYRAPSQANATAVYIWHAEAIISGPPTFQAADADLREIISPTIDPNYARDNPACAGARIRIRNGGADTLRTLLLRYRTGGAVGTWQTYQWTGALAFLTETEISLPLLPGALSQPVGASATGHFEVEVSLPNGLADPNPWNDHLTSTYAAVPVQTVNPFVVEFYTNEQNANGFNETAWILTDAATGAVVAQRVDVASSSVYYDTVALAPGCYNFRFLDTGCDGYSFFASGASSGEVRWLRTNRPTAVRSFDGDFGCESNFRFIVAAPTGLVGADAPGATLEVYPNPTTTGEVTLDFDLPQAQDVMVRVVSPVDGRLLRRAELPAVRSKRVPFSLRGLPRGLYLLECSGAQGVRFWRRVAVE